MRVLHIATSVVEQSASFRIHKAVAGAGIESFVYVLGSSLGNPRVICSQKRTFFKSIPIKLKKKILPLIERSAIKAFSYTTGTPVSLGLVSAFDRALVEKINPDIVHLHWICAGFLSVKDVMWLSQRYPLVWTLHDSWAFTGGCHIPFECKKYSDQCQVCPQLKSKNGIDLADKVFSLKKKYYCSAKFHIVTPSRWLEDCVQKSKILYGKPVHVVPNPLNVKRFNVKDKSFVRDTLGFSPEKKYILFGAMNSTSDENKGFRFVHEAMQLFSQRWKGVPVEIVIFGSDKPDDAPNFKLPVHYMGRLHDDISLSLLYSVADVMIVPSKSENFPNTVLEAMGCGTPCVAFRIGGIPEQITHLENGYLAEPYDSSDLANGIEYVLSDDARWKKLSCNARDKVAVNYREDVIAEQYIKLYKEIIEECGKK